MSRLTPIALAFAVSTTACSGESAGVGLGGDDDSIAVADGGGTNVEKPDGGHADANPETDANAVDAGDADAGIDDAGALDASDADASNIDAGGGLDGGPPLDTTAPLAVSNLAASVVGPTTLTLSWTAPEDPPGGDVSSYELRYSKTNITSVADFAAASVISVPAPKAHGSAESLIVPNLEPSTTYYFGLRAHDAAGNISALSNIASAATNPWVRASVLISEVSMVSNDGNFIELLVTQAGNLKDVSVQQADFPTVLHTFANFDVALGDRIVVHITGKSMPPNFTQEDAAHSKTASDPTYPRTSVEAWDVYADVIPMLDSDNLIRVVDGTNSVDAVAYSNRDGDVPAAMMSAFAAAKAEGSWAFTEAPVDTVNDCATQRDAVGASKADQAPNDACAGFPTMLHGSLAASINRIGTTDTNSKNDWYVAAMTRGTSNSAIPEAKLVYVWPRSDTVLDLSFDQELDESTVSPSDFVASGLTIQAAALLSPHSIRVTTSMLNGPHKIGVVGGLKTIYGTAATGTQGFCGYGDGMLRFSEINPTIPGSTAVGNDLVELVVTKAGSIKFTVEVNPKNTQPFNYAVATADTCGALGDVIVVHLDPHDPSSPAKREALAKDELPAATFSGFYDSAWDFQSYQTGRPGLPNGDGVVALRRSSISQAYVDAVVYTDADGDVTTNAEFIASLQYMQSRGMWLPADCGGAPCTASSTPPAEAIAVPLTGIGKSATTSSLRKTSIGDPSTAASWSVGPQSWGSINP